MNAVHDEYVQLLAETGTVGFVLVALVFFAVGHRASHNIFNLPRDQFAVIAALIASLGGTRHAGCFGLSDANTRHRAASDDYDRLLDPRGIPSMHYQCDKYESKRKGKFVAFGTIAALLAVTWRVALQPQAPYPYDSKTPHGYEEMRRLLLAHPANSRVHLTSSR